MRAGHHIEEFEDGATERWLEKIEKERQEKWREEWIKQIRRHERGRKWRRRFEFAKNLSIAIVLSVSTMGVVSLFGIACYIAVTGAF